jgi:hypothetical protein
MSAVEWDDSDGGSPRYKAFIGGTSYSWYTLNAGVFNPSDS